MTHVLTKHSLHNLSYLVDLLLIIVALMWVVDERFILGFVVFIVVELREINRNVKIYLSKQL